MSDDLRDRIAKAIHESAYNIKYRAIGLHGSRTFADAVIAELERANPPYCIRCGLPHDSACRRDKDK